MMVSCKSIQGNDSNLELNLEHVPELSFIQMESIDQLDFAWALLSVSWPHNVERINQMFEDLLEFSEIDIVGQNLHRIRPRHALSGGWRAMLRSASGGRAARDVLEVRSLRGREFLADISCIPTVSGPDNMSMPQMLAIFVDASASTISAGLMSLPVPTLQAPAQPCALAAAPDAFAGGQPIVDSGFSGEGFQASPDHSSRGGRTHTAHSTTNATAPLPKQPMAAMYAAESPFPHLTQHAGPAERAVRVDDAHVRRLRRPLAAAAASPQPAASHRTSSAAALAAEISGGPDPADAVGNRPADHHDPPAPPPPASESESGP
jgi:hypothetical protein